MDKHISFEEKEIDFMNSHCKVQVQDYLEIENNAHESDEIESSDSEESSEYVSEAEELREDVIPNYISSESDDNSVHITFHTDVDSEYFNEIFEHSFRSHELENNEETKEDGSIS